MRPSLRFPSPVCGILDTTQGGSFTVAPDGVTESRQFYEPDTGVLVTDLRGSSGLVRITDAFTLRFGADLAEDAPAGRTELLRQIEVLHGRTRLRIDVAPRQGARVEGRAGGLRLRCPSHPELDLQLFSTVPLKGLGTIHELDPGECLHLVLRWGGGAYSHTSVSPDDLLKATVDAWRRWIRVFAYQGPQEPLVRRSAITLKMLDYFENGAMVAAPTSSLPEAIGGLRNWDYRYAWIRDAAYSVYALRRIGMTNEARGFLGWVLDAIAREGRPHVLYDLDGNLAPAEKEDPALEGYRRSAPVRWGNAAAEQRQHDVFGEVVDCAYQWAAQGGGIDVQLWEHLQTLVKAARREWRQADWGIWEVRTQGRPFTYSAALCHVALDRGAHLAERFGLPGEIDAWRGAAQEIQQAILTEAWDSRLNSLTEQLGGGALDASLLALPLRRVVAADHPKMVATTAAIAERLGAGHGLLYRYNPEISPDGLPGSEGAFLICSFWLVDNLARQGRLNEALELYNTLCARANPLGLLPEQTDPATGAFLGNYPQALSHVGVISSGANLARLMGMNRE
jgi:alpha,alpha-trehalase